MQLQHLIFAGLAATATASAVIAGRAPTYTCPVVCPVKATGSLRTLVIVPATPLTPAISVGASIPALAPVQHLESVCCTTPGGPGDVLQVSSSLVPFGLGAGLSLSVASIQKGCVVQTDDHFSCAAGLGAAFCCNTYVTLSTVIGLIGVDCVPAVPS